MKIGIGNSMAKKIFISLPMRGHTYDEVHKRMNDIYDLAVNTLDEPCELINTMWTEAPSNLDNQTWYLGKSIQVIGDADLVIFSSGWAQAKGCVIERFVCDLYGLHKLNEEDLWDLQDLKFKIEEELNGHDS